MKTTRYRTRRLTKLEREMREKYTRLVDFSAILDRNYVAEFVIDFQWFRVCTESSQERAVWYRNMLAIALAKLVTKESL